jgi:ribosome-associated toxin RatA of RatAB toxin-antitoxin module
MSRLPVEEKEGIKGEIRRLRRNWIEELLGGQEEVELIIDFKNYVQRLVEVIVNELYVTQEVRIYPVYESSKDYASYLIDDIQIDVYFASENNNSLRHPKYQSAVQEFKNFEYLINATKNEGILKVPFMTLFDYKGFVGMAKSKVGSNRTLKNKEFYDIINRKEFEEITRISAETLLNESKCKIVSYERLNTGNKFNNKVYFTEELADFLPLENGREFGTSTDKFLRAELVTDDEFQDQIFRDRVKIIKSDKINSLLEKKVDEFISVLENEENYFTNSQELSELLHLYGINIRYLGVIVKRTKLSWLRKIFQAEIAARCLKNYFRLEIQNSILYSQPNQQERQEDRERIRVISFLNTVFGNTDPTFKLWRNLNVTAMEKYHVKIWDSEFTNLNSGYLLQAIQTHFKILLSHQAIDRTVFRTTNTFDFQDFIRFEFDSRIYSLDFTNTFDQINESFEDESTESFQFLCELLTKETSTKVSYLELLRTHPIHDRISQFLLNFASPADNAELYNKIESKSIPHKFLYESKLAEIKWYLKANKQDNISKVSYFF